MKKFIFIFILISSFASSAERDIYMPFTEKNSKYWQFISDRTMGGVSDGEAILEKDGETFFARLRGNVSTKNNGGFW